MRFATVISLAAAIGVTFTCSKGFDKSTGPQNWPLVFEEDFSRGTGRWMLSSSSQWQTLIVFGNAIFCLIEPGQQGRLRAPRSWAVVKGLDLRGFAIEGRLQCQALPEVQSRDLVVFFNFQDSLHFAYVHFSAKSDDVHNIIGLVNGTDRVKINREPAGASQARLVDKKWHRFRVSYDPATNEVKAYLNDFAKPVLTAVDTMLCHGTVGVGSFDDTGCFDDIQVWGPK